jgi:hypothetical protein
MSKRIWLDLAEITDSLRVFPRLFLVATVWWVADTGYLLLDWYMGLAKEDRSLEASGFASIAWLAALGFLKLVYDRYSAAGRSWGPPAPTERTSTTIATQTTETQ